MSKGGLSAARTRPLAPPGWPTHQRRKGASRCYRPKLVGSPLGTRTIQSVHVLLRSALGHAVELELLQVNPTDRIPKDLRPRHKPELAEGKHWEPDQAARFLDSTQDDRWHALWALGSTPAPAGASCWRCAGPTSTGMPAPSASPATGW